VPPPTKHSLESTFNHPKNTPQKMPQNTKKSQIQGKQTLKENQRNQHETQNRRKPAKSPARRTKNDRHQRHLLSQESRINAESWAPGPDDPPQVLTQNGPRITTTKTQDGFPTAEASHDKARDLPATQRKNRPPPQSGNHGSAGASQSQTGNHGSAGASPSQTGNFVLAENISFVSSVFFCGDIHPRQHPNNTLPFPPTVRNSILLQLVLFQSFVVCIRSHPCHYPQIQLFVAGAFGNRPLRPESQPRTSKNQTLAPMERLGFRVTTRSLPRALDFTLSR
jgi:hypothetical protein